MIDLRIINTKTIKNINVKSNEKTKLNQKSCKFTGFFKLILFYNILMEIINKITLIIWLVVQPKVRLDS